jgi:SET domain-containing protein
MAYLPLPDNVTIKKSKIHGLGLFAKNNIPKDTKLGLTHIFIGEEIVRTPLGGFYNHSDDPNCSTYYPLDDLFLVTDRLCLRTIKDIQKGEEITVKYTLYSVDV